MNLPFITLYEFTHLLAQDIITFLFWLVLHFLEFQLDNMKLKTIGKHFLNIFKYLDTFQLTQSYDYVPHQPPPFNLPLVSTSDPKGLQILNC